MMPSTSPTPSQGSEPTPEMIDRFIVRTNEHIDRVSHNLGNVSKHVDFEFIAEELAIRAQEHDQSKFSPEEKKPYVWLTEYYRCKNFNIPFSYPQGVEDTIRPTKDHHFSVNRHHPEYHSDLNAMTDIDIIEMVCDWTAKSQEFPIIGETVRQWADSKIGTRWIFNENRKELIYKVIEILEAHSAPHDAFADLEKH